MIAPVYAGAADQERERWRRAAYIAHQSAQLSRVKRIPDLRKYLANWDEQKPVTEAEIARAIKTMKGGNRGK